MHLQQIPSYGAYRPRQMQSFVLHASHTEVISSLRFQVTRVLLMPPPMNFHEGVYIVDCIWEFFVLVGSKARGHRQDIRLGLVVASVRLDVFTPHIQPRR